MDNKEYSGYQVADITESDNSMIDRLGKKKKSVRRQTKTLYW